MDIGRSTLTTVSQMMIKTRILMNSLTMKTLQEMISQVKITDRKKMMIRNMKKKIQSRKKGRQ
jgi:hypothetical protein